MCMRYVSIQQTIRYSICKISDIACGPPFRTILFSWYPHHQARPVDTTLPLTEPYISASYPLPGEHNTPYCHYWCSIIFYIADTHFTADLSRASARFSWCIIPFISNNRYKTYMDRVLVLKGCMHMCSTQSSTVWTLWLMVKWWYSWQSLGKTQTHIIDQNLNSDQNIKYSGTLLIKTQRNSK